VKGWRFVPARRGAQNIEGWVRVPVVFKLES
jgi:protein TonB